MKTRTDTKKTTVKKTTSKVAHVNNPSGKGPVIQDGFLHFGPFDLAQYELAQAKVLNALQAIGLKKAEADRARRTYEDAIRKINDELQLITQSSNKAEVELRSLQEELQGVYKLDFTQVAYDDVTGKISVLGSPVPEDEFLSK